MPTAPVFSEIADLFWWKTTKTLTSNVIGNAGQYATDQIKILGNSFFVFVAWRGETNYDSVTELRAIVGGGGGAAATALYSAAVPNNFEASVSRNNRFKMMDRAMPQAALCSTGYRAGQQVPWPIIYAPLTMFNFTVANVAPVMLTKADQTTQIPLRVDFGLFGYNVLGTNLPSFLAQWPELYGKAMGALTNLSIPSIPTQ